MILDLHQLNIGVARQCSKRNVKALRDVYKIGALSLLLSLMLSSMRHFVLRESLIIPPL